MKILFLTTRFPCPPDRGDKVRPYNFAKSLAGRHDLSLVTFVHARDKPDNAEANRVFRRVWRVKAPGRASLLRLPGAVVTGRPLQNALFRSATFQAATDAALAEVKPDIVYCFHMRMAQYIEDAKGYYRVIDLCDAVSLFLRRMAGFGPWWRRPLARLEGAMARRYEQRVHELFEEVWLISTVDRDAIRGADRWDNLTLVPNGVDTTYFTPSHERRPGKNILFVGYMGAESVDTIRYFYRQIFPLVRREEPESRFIIVGANPPKDVRRLNRDPSVEVVGFAPDLRPYYEAAAVLAAPMRFVVGMQNKILEAMAMQVPVVTTSSGNEGIDGVPGRHLFVEDSPERFATSVIRILHDEVLAERIGHRAREFVIEKYHWRHVSDRLDMIEQRLCGARRSVPAPSSCSA